MQVVVRIPLLVVTARGDPSLPCTRSGRFDLVCTVQGLIWTH